MSVDLIGWETLKKLDFIKRLDNMLAASEQLEDIAKEFEPHLEKIEDDNLKTAIKAPGLVLMTFMQLQRDQIIWVNAMIEGMIKIEDRLDRLENERV